MFTRDEINLALDLHRRSYKLLKWFSSALNKGFIHFDRAHDYLDEATAAKEWIHGHYSNLPPSCRPSLEHLDAFARFFATYLSTSFDLTEYPAKQLSSDCGCYCPICSYLSSASHLTPKKLGRHDKERAKKLKLFAVKQLALEHGRAIDDHEAAQLINAGNTAKEIATIAYARQLLARMRGNSEGPAVLALWREIAWEGGGPKKDFNLEPEQIFQAERSVFEAIVARTT